MHAVWPAALINWRQRQIARNTHSGDEAKTAERWYPLYELWTVNIINTSDSWGDSLADGMKDPSLSCLLYLDFINLSAVMCDQRMRCQCSHREFPRENPLTCLECLMIRFIFWFFWLFSWGLKISTMRMSAVIWTNKNIIAINPLWYHKQVQ